MSNTPIGVLDCGVRVLRTDPTTSSYSLPQYVCPREQGPFAVGFDLCCMPIGTRGYLTEAHARQTGRAWSQLTQTYPQIALAISLNGFADDPRPLWEVPEIVAYVRLWAIFSGMVDLDVARAAVNAKPCGDDMFQVIPVLGACGVYGERARQQYLLELTPPATAH